MFTLFPHLGNFLKKEIGISFNYLFCLSFAVIFNRFSLVCWGSRDCDVWRIKLGCDEFTNVV